LYRYYDIHTHNKSQRAGCLSIVNLYEGFDAAPRFEACSVGLHPWHLENHDVAFRELEKEVALGNVLAIGECGLDKVCDTDWQLQNDIFSKQIELAERSNKPLVIHCVRAYEEVMRMLEEQHVTVPVIFHGFNKNMQLAKQLVSKGYYLSFGEALMSQKGHAADALSAIPADQFFLETDDNPTAITDIYQKAAAILNTTEEGIILQVQKNFQNVFRK